MNVLPVLFMVGLGTLLLLAPQNAGSRSGPSTVRKRRESFRQTGKHAWFAISSDGADFPTGHYRTREEALRAAQAKSTRMGRGKIREVYHLDDA